LYFNVLTVDQRGVVATISDDDLKAIVDSSRVLGRVKLDVERADIAAARFGGQLVRRFDQNDAAGQGGEDGRTRLATRARCRIIGDGYCLAGIVNLYGRSVER